jgi:hypothetical protein
LSGSENIIEVDDDMTYGVLRPEGHWHYPESVKPEEPEYFNLEKKVLEKKVKDQKVRDLIAEESKLPKANLNGGSEFLPTVVQKNLCRPTIWR